MRAFLGQRRSSSNIAERSQGAGRADASSTSSRRSSGSSQAQSAQGCPPPRQQQQRTISTPPPPQRGRDDSSPDVNNALDELRERTGRAPVRPSSSSSSRPFSSSRNRPSPGSRRGSVASNTSWQTSSAPAVIRSYTPPPYAQHSLDRSPLANPMVLDDRPRVPPPIFLRGSAGPQSKLGTLTIHVPSWGVVLIRPPRHHDLHPLEAGTQGREPPAEDTVLSGSLEVNMKERRRCQAISIGVQGVSKLNMGVSRGWEEDGVFERGVEIATGEGEDGIWLEKGSQTFSFTILLPATLATYDYHQFGRISYILTARVEGISPSGRLGSFFKSREIPLQGDIPFYSDFQVVIARSDQVAEQSAKGGLGMSRGGSREGYDRSPTTSLTGLSPRLNALGIGADDGLDESAVALDDAVAAPPPGGLYHRRGSSDMIPVLPSTSGLRSSPLRKDTDASSVVSFGSEFGDKRSEKAGWLVGDLSIVRKLAIYANPSPTGGVYQLDLRKEGYVDGLGPWRFSAQSDAFSIASVMLVSLNLPHPSPSCSIFFVRLLLSQTYSIISPRTPNDAPHRPEQARNHVLYQTGRPHQHGESRLPHTASALWRGTAAGGTSETAPASGFRTRAVARLPNHEKIRPTTEAGTITPIRVQHELLVRIFYSVEGETVAGKPLDGPGEVRMMQVRLPIVVPSCSCSIASLNLPTYELAAECEDVPEPDPSRQCSCGLSFRELNQTAIRRRQDGEYALEEEWADRCEEDGMAILAAKLRAEQGHSRA